MKDCIWPSLWWKGYFPPFDWVPRDSAVKTETKPLIDGHHHITLNKCYIWIISSLEIKLHRSIEMCSERNRENGNHDHRSPMRIVSTPQLVLMVRANFNTVSLLHSFQGEILYNLCIWIKVLLCTIFNEGLNCDDNGECPLKEYFSKQI